MNNSPVNDLENNTNDNRQTVKLPVSTIWDALVLAGTLPIEKFIELTSAFNTSLREFQAEQGIIDTDAPFMERGSYATWPQLRDSTRVTLAKHKLSIIQHPARTQQNPTMITMLKHDNGYYEIYESPITKESEYLEPKEMGKHITYFKRYTYSSVLGLATEEDKINDLDNKIKGEENNPQEGICPLCNSKLCKRKGSKGEFIGCSGYPNCTYSRPI